MKENLPPDKRAGPGLTTHILRILLGSGTSPILAAVAIMLATLSLVYTISERTQFFDDVIIFAGLLLAGTILVITYLSFDGGIRFLPLMQRSFYSYETLDSKIEWDILSTDGKVAVLRKRRTLRFYETTQVIREYVWGAQYDKGSEPTIDDFKVDPGHIAQIYREGGKYVVLIALDRPFRSREVVKFYFERTLRDCFTTRSEWVEVQSVSPLSGSENVSVSFPEGRPYISALARYRHIDFTKIYSLGEHQFSAEIANGRHILNWRIVNSIPGDSYFIEWEW